MFLKILLVFVPVVIVLDWLSASKTLAFICACLAIVPLADYTEGLAEFLGPTPARLPTPPSRPSGGLSNPTRKAKHPF